MTSIGPPEPTQGRDALDLGAIRGRLADGVILAQDTLALIREVEQLRDVAAWAIYDGYLVPEWVQDRHARLIPADAGEVPRRGW